MTATLKNTLLGLVIGLSTSVGISVLAQDKPPAAEAKFLGPPIPAHEFDSTVPHELIEPAEAIVLALNQKEVDKAFSVMTDKGADQYMGMMLMQFAQLGQLEGVGEANDGLVQLKKVIGKYGLDKVQMEMPMVDDAADAEKMVEEVSRAMEKTEKRLLGCIPEGERRKATRELVEASAKIMKSPMSYAVGKCEIKGQNAELQSPGLDAKSLEQLNKTADAIEAVKVSQ